MFDKITFEFVKQNNNKINFENEIEKMPYIFVDPHRFNKKIDPKKLQFGSKIDNNGGKREEYFTVKDYFRLPV